MTLIKNNYKINFKKFLNHPKKFILSILLSLIVLLSLISLYLAYFNPQKAKTTEPIQVTENTSPVRNYPSPSVEECSSSNIEQRSFNFVETVNVTDKTEVDKIHYALLESSYLKNQFNISEDILSMFYSKKNNRVFYLTGYRSYYNDHPDHTRKVNILDLNTHQTSTIFSLKTEILSRDSDISDDNILRSISLSPDENELMLITDTDIFIYDINKNEYVFSDAPRFNPQYHNEDFKDALKTYRHYYHLGLMAEDNKYAVLGQGYWESMSYFLYSLETKTVSPMNIAGGNGGGEYVLGWLKNRFLYKHAYMGENTVFCLDAVERNNKVCVNSSVDTTDDLIKIIDDKVYVLSDKTDINDSGCEQTDSALLAYSFDDLTERELLQVNLTKDQEIVNFSQIDFRGKSMIVLRLKNNGENIYALLDPKNPEKLIKLTL